MFARPVFRMSAPKELATLWKGYPFRIKFYFWTYKQLGRVVGLLQGLFDGFWLGVLGRRALQLADECKYDSSQEYHGELHNKRGLFPWEEAVVATYFRNCRRLLVGGAGGGREVLALCQAGHEVDGFECHPELMTFANELLSKEGFAANVQLVPRDKCPDDDRVYDGIIVGWSAYMHIQGESKRVGFLKELRGKLAPGAPLLISFWHPIGPVRLRLRVGARLGKLLRWLRRGESIQLGDSLQPYYTHFFDREGVGAELRQAGFELALHDPWFGHEYAHAVGIATELVAGHPSGTAT